MIYGENYSNLTKIFVLMLFKMVANQSYCSGLEPRSDNIFLVARKCKPGEIYRKCVMYTKKYISVKNMITNGLNMDLPLQD